MLLYTKGFESLRETNRHYQEHGDDFGFPNPEAYEDAADLFLGGAKPLDVYECTRRCGYILRYDANTEAFGIIDKDGIIRTYYKPIPCAKVPFAERQAAVSAGRCHKYPSNLVYFKMECLK
jgi:pyocin large subunit-like protein